jgi:hypothetical protein
MNELHKPIIRVLLTMFVLMNISSNANAEDVDVIDVVITGGSSNIKGQYRFSVTLKHADSGWDHYADKWQVVGAYGTVYGTRVLAHPHVNEQPFTRSLDRVEIPENIKQVTIRGGDNLDSKGGKTVTVDLPKL